MATWRHLSEDKGYETLENSSNCTRIKPFVLILVGIPGSGKSTFASYLEKCAPSIYARVNQDSLGDRKTCEKLTRQILRNNKVPVIDRCNVDFQQRKHWIDIAREAGVPCECVVFSYDAETCIDRCKRRKNHKTVHSENARFVVFDMINQFHPPEPSIDLRSRSERNRNSGEYYRHIQYVSSFENANRIAEIYIGRR